MIENGTGWDDVPRGWEEDMAEGDANPPDRKPRVLVACEFSGIVREAFIRRGALAWSCDLLPSEIPGPFHYQGDVSKLLHGPLGMGPWDLLVAFPPCTYLAASGARWFAERRVQQEKALTFVQMLMDAPIKHIAIENPVGVISTRIRKPDQIIQPWMFGHPESKATCLWLKNLPRLNPTQIVAGRAFRVHRESPGSDRWKRRSRTLHGIAEAIAEQWCHAVMEDFLDVPEVCRR